MSGSLPWRPRRDTERRPIATRRLLIAPAVLLAGFIVGLHQLVAATPHTTDPELAVTEELAPPAMDEERRCSRHDPDQAVEEEIRATVGRSARITSGMVVACPIAFDGRYVRYVGELVGDLLERDGGAWVLVNDDDYALEVGPLTAHRDHRGTNSGLAVWLPTPLLADVTGLGRPNRRGDVVEVAGVVVRADEADGGGLTLRADSMQVIRPAVSIDEPLDRPQLWFAAAAVALAVLLWSLRRAATARGRARAA